MPHTHEIVVIIPSDMTNSRMVEGNKPLDLFPGRPLNFLHRIFNILLDFIICDCCSTSVYSFNTSSCSLESLTTCFGFPAASELNPGDAACLFLQYLVFE